MKPVLNSKLAVEELHDGNRGWLFYKLTASNHCNYFCFASCWQKKNFADLHFRFCSSLNVVFSERYIFRRCCLVAYAACNTVLKRNLKQAESLLSGIWSAQLLERLTDISSCNYSIHLRKTFRKKLFSPRNGTMLARKQSRHIKHTSTRKKHLDPKNSFALQNLWDFSKNIYVFWEYSFINFMWVFMSRPSILRRARGQ